MIGTVQCLGDARFCVSTVPRIDNRCGRDFQTTNCANFTNLASAFNFYELDLQLNYELLAAKPIARTVSSTKSILRIWKFVFDALYT